MKANALGAWLLSAGLGLWAGCSVLIKSDKKQCTKDTQCMAPYVCGNQGVCTVKTGCSVDEECRQPGKCIAGMCKPPECVTTENDCDPDELCNTVSGACVKAVTADCDDQKDCTAYEGAQVCVQSSKRCGAFECLEQKDCTRSSPTARCKAGACVDETWSCLGVKDPRREQNSSATASLRFQVLYTPAEQVAVKNPQVKVCAPLDRECMNPFRVSWDYDKDKFLLIEGLEAGRLFRIQIQAKDPMGIPLLPVEYLMYRPAYGVTEDPLPVLMFHASFRDATAASAGSMVDPNLAFVLMRIFDCSDREVQGVQVTPDKLAVGCVGGCSTKVFYPDAGWNPDVNATATTAGRAGIVNVSVDQQTSFTLTRAADARKVTSFVFKPRGGWITYVHVWPWNFNP